MADIIKRLEAQINRMITDGEVEQSAIDEIERLRRYADAMNGKPGTERHIYNGACPDNGQPDSRDPECPACRLLVPNA